MLHSQRRAKRHSSSPPAATTIARLTPPPPPTMFPASMQCVGPSAYADAASVSWFAAPTCSCDAENNLVSVTVDMGPSHTWCWSGSSWQTENVPACISESSLTFCDDGSGYIFKCHFSLPSSGPHFCGVFEYECLGSVCVPSGRFIDNADIVRVPGAGTYSAPTPVQSSYGWQQVAASTGDVKCCGVTQDSVDYGSGYNYGLGYNADDRAWDIEDNAWTLFGLTWVFLFATAALTVFQYVTSARAKVSQMQRRVARGGQIPSRHPVAVAAPPPQQTVVMMPAPPTPAIAPSNA